MTMDTQQNNRSNLPPLIGVKATASFLGVSERLVRSLCATGNIKAVKVGAVWRINRDALLAQCGLL